MSNKQTIKRTKSEGYLENYILSDLQRYLDEKSENKIKKILGDEYVDGIRLYKFPIQKCKEIKAYELLEKNKSDEIKELLEKIKEETKEKTKEIKAYKLLEKNKSDKIKELLKKIKEKRKKLEEKTKDSIFHHSMNNKAKFMFKQNIDLNALSIISYKLAEKFANDSGKFKIGNLKDTELVEFHTYVTNEPKKKSGVLRKHKDDGAVVGYNTITLIWFLIKDKKINGGNIFFYTNSYSQNEEKVTINLWDQIDNLREKCVCLIFKGNIEHCPEKIGGLGERSSIVFQFERIDNNEGKVKTRKNKKSRKSRGGKKRTRKI